jgi:hypothetical protein
MGHHIDLATKVKGKNSMCGKARCSETTKLYARRDPDGMVNAGLREPKCPYCQERRLGKVVDAQVLPDHQDFAAPVVNALQGSWVALRNRKDTKGAPPAVLNVKQARNAGLPTGREP